MDDFEKKTFLNDLGINAKIARAEGSTEETRTARDLLVGIGKILTPRKGLNYVGSAAVHVYQSEHLRQIFFVSQAGTLGQIPEETASAAFTDLKKQMKEFYGRKSGKLRSGF